MAKYVIICPACQKALQASTGLFSKKKIKCVCGYLIDTNLEKLTEELCPHCGNTVIYDRTKSKKAECPVCHAKINTGKERVKFTCPNCKIELLGDENSKTYTCPQCKTLIDVQARLQQEKYSGQTSVIAWDMRQNDIFIYRHPIENFNIGSQLIVSEGQKAIFVRNGKGLDCFGPGRHILETQKLPLLEELLKFPTDADLTFDSKVYFVRTNRLNVKWGVPDIRLRNPEMEFYINIGISGSMDVQVIEGNENIRKFFEMVIGSSTGVEHNEPIGAGESYTTQYIEEKFRDIVKTRISDLMAEAIIVNNINVLDIETKKIFISDVLRKDFNGILEEYGLVIPEKHFNLTTIKIHNNEDVERWRQQEAERSIRTRENKLAEDISRSAQGRIRAEEDNFALRGVLHTQYEGEIKKTGVKADMDAARIAALGRQDVKLTDVDTSAQALRIDALGNADAVRIKAQAEGDAESLRAPGKAEAMVTMAHASGEASKERALGESDALRIRSQAEGDAAKLRASGQAESIVTMARAEAESSKTIASGESEAIRLTGNANAEVTKAQGLAEAEELRAKGLAEAEGLKAKGYTYEQETKREVANAVFKNGLPGTGGGGVNSGTPIASGSNIGGLVGDMVGLGMGMAVASSTVQMMKPIIGSSVEMGNDIVSGVNRSTGLGWNCVCGKANISSAFCPDCGSKKPDPQPQVDGGWNCNCGCKNITSKFCPDCGSPCPSAPASWDCPKCGLKNITSNFCPDCGSRKEG
jgi:membrane protease subunit (stomatin/prohibitin family)/predicted RNA-binding Zn-ribbon protein involved in translation (DUF1610 family)/regulator of protease activity HflC (stomatin/prohibitin superfamily)